MDKLILKHYSSDIYDLKWSKIVLSTMKYVYCLYSVRFQFYNLIVLYWKYLFCSSLVISKVSWGFISEDVLPNQSTSKTIWYSFHFKEPCWHILRERRIATFTVRSILTKLQLTKSTNRDFIVDLEHITISDLRKDLKIKI